jgi:membrane-bound metal-dependent hydrolase YbcI (DUF457 family)
MLILGHLGFTLAAGKTAEAAYDKVSQRQVAPGSSSFDHRLLAVGALLPDLIDKPLFWLPFLDFFDVSRAVGHSLLFPLLLVILWRAGPERLRRIMLPLALGSLLHLVLDGLLAEPQALLWPLLGWEFVQDGPSDLFSSLPIPWELPWNLSWLAVSELLGAAMGGVLARRWWRERKGRRPEGGGVRRYMPAGSLVAESGPQVR